MRRQPSLKILAVGVTILLIIFISRAGHEMQMETMTLTPLETKFQQLSTQGNAFCTDADGIAQMGDRLKGSCCSPMSMHRYEEQVEGLKKYAAIETIPKDPYDISLEHAQMLLEYKKDIILTQDQQDIYNSAMKLSDEGGPCCCECWRWDVYEGLAKYLITEYGFTAEQISDIWNMSDGCGGEEHASGMHS